MSDMTAQEAVANLIDHYYECPDITPIIRDRSIRVLRDIHIYGSRFKVGDRVWALWYRQILAPQQRVVSLVFSETGRLLIVLAPLHLPIAPEDCFATEAEAIAECERRGVRTDETSVRV